MAAIGNRVPNTVDTGIVTGKDYMLPAVAERYGLEHMTDFIAMKLASHTYVKKRQGAVVANGHVARSSGVDGEKVSDAGEFSVVESVEGGTESPSARLREFGVGVHPSLVEPVVVGGMVDDGMMIRLPRSNSGGRGGVGPVRAGTDDTTDPADTETASTATENNEVSQGAAITLPDTAASQLDQCDHDDDDDRGSDSGLAKSAEVGIVASNSDGLLEGNNPSLDLGKAHVVC
jgi:hypothetical protein